MQKLAKVQNLKMSYAVNNGWHFKGLKNGITW